LVIHFPVIPARRGKNPIKKRSVSKSRLGLFSIREDIYMSITQKIDWTILTYLLLNRQRFVSHSMRGIIQRAVIPYFT